MFKLTSLIILLNINKRLTNTTDNGIIYKGDNYEVYDYKRSCREMGD